MIIDTVKSADTHLTEHIIESKFSISKNEFLYIRELFLQHAVLAGNLVLHITSDDRNWHLLFYSTVPLLVKRTFLISLFKTFKNGHSVVILVSDQNTHDRLRFDQLTEKFEASIFGTALCFRPTSMSSSIAVDTSPGLDSIAEIASSNTSKYWLAMFSNSLLLNAASSVSSTLLSFL
ncbi:hypothetical protein T07_4910 [Trichinella nelsoni]|uniref:Uncharacterized protein n=1 Tax=Trichinella nelsoni TaxID=6336 RepID=A0A0V0RPQ5_9BILA|nr:hypothetical protein T07_4910 [Trichinella nelsoni]